MALLLCNPLWKSVGNGARSSMVRYLLCDGSLLLSCGAVVHGAVVQGHVYQVPLVLFRISVAAEHLIG